MHPPTIAEPDVSPDANVTPSVDAALVFVADWITGVVVSTPDHSEKCARSHCCTVPAVRVTVIVPAPGDDPATA